MTARTDLARKGRRHLPEPYHLPASGLPNVTLRNGVSIGRASRLPEGVIPAKAGTQATSHQGQPALHVSPLPAWRLT